MRIWLFQFLGRLRNLKDIDARQTSWFLGDSILGIEKLFVTTELYLVQQEEQRFQIFRHIL